MCIKAFLSRRGWGDAMPSTDWSFLTRKLLDDEKRGSIILRLMMVVNDISITNSQMFEWQNTEELEEKYRSRGAILYFGRVQSAHLFEALNIIREIRDNADLRKRVERCNVRTVSAFATVEKFLDSDDYKMMAMMRNAVAFHYDQKLSMRRIKKLVDLAPDHRTEYSRGADTLDWCFSLGGAKLQMKCSYAMFSGFRKSKTCVPLHSKSCSEFMQLAKLSQISLAGSFGIVVQNRKG